MLHSRIRRLFAILALAAATAFAAPIFSRISFAVPPRLPTIADPQGRSRGLEALRGKIVMLHFWATWCAPCRKEFPVLDRLQGQWGAQGFVVVPVCLGCTGFPAIDAFYRQLGIANLAKYTGDLDAFAKEFNFNGLPRTFVLDRDGNEGFPVHDPGDWDGSDGDKLRALIER